MIELLVFISAQLLLNLFVRFVANTRLTDVFIAFAMLFFVVSILAYPMFSWRIYDIIYPPDPNLKFRCGNPMIGAAMFQWIIGTPFVILFQWLLNKYLHKSNATKDVNEPTRFDEGV